jgi:8-oxo-dGTP pyrophosphatase MutT (NUDIX family)
MNLDQLQGTAPRKGLDYIGVTCAFLCHDDDGRFLLHRRSARCRDEQGRWDSGAGALEFGESFEEAVRREVREEYCVDPLEVRFVDVRNVLRGADGELSHWIALLFLARVDPAGVAIGEPGKMDEIGWFTPDDLPSPLHSQFDDQLQMMRAAGIA